MNIKEYKEYNKNKIYTKLYFNTLSFEQFSELGNAFYPPAIFADGLDCIKRKKVLPLDLKQ